MRDYTKIDAWRLADDLAVAIDEKARSFPKDEQYGLTSQLRRASHSVPAHIVEGFSRNSDSSGRSRFSVYSVYSAVKAPCLWLRLCGSAFSAVKSPAGPGRRGAVHFPQAALARSSCAPRTAIVTVREEVGFPRIQCIPRLKLPAFGCGFAALRSLRLNHWLAFQLSAFSFQLFSC